MTRIDVSEHSAQLTDIEMIQLRDHIGRAYQLAEELAWCDPESHFNVHERTISSATDDKPREAVVPVISTDFSTHDAARQSLTEIQNAARENGLNVYDVHYDKPRKSLGVALEPFDV